MKFIVHLLRIFVICGITVFSSRVYADNRIVISDMVNSQIGKALSEPLRTLAIDTVMVKQNHQLIRTWVSGSLDLNKAAPRTNKRFDRRTYSQEQKTEVLRNPNERLLITGESSGMIKKQGDVFPVQPEVVKEVKLNMLSLQRAEVKVPVKVSYREGSSYYNFIKIKERPAQNALSQQEAFALVREFLQSNRMIQETQDDRIGAMYLQNRMVNRELDQGRSTDILMQQDVVIERSFQGKPVINSKIIVGLQPDSREIVAFKHYNWTPVASGMQKSDPVAASGKGAKVLDPEVIVRRLEDKIVRSSGDFTIAEVQRVIPAWYQDGDTMIPVMGFDIAIQYSSPKGALSRNYFEVLNLTGDDQRLMPNKAKNRKPENPR